jgi:WD40 repeat protein
MNSVNEIEPEMDFRPSFNSSNSLINNYDKNFYMLKSLSSLSWDGTNRLNFHNSRSDQDLPEKEYPIQINECQDLSHSSKYVINKNCCLKMEAELMNLRVNPTGALVACGLLNGSIAIVDIDNGRLVKSFPTSHGRFSVTSIRWKPVYYSNSVFTATNADGSVSSFDLSSGKQIFKIQPKDKEQLLALDYNVDSTMFAVGAHNGNIHLYNEHTQKEVRTFGSASLLNNGHSNRVFSLKFLPDDHNVFVSGGWDGTVFIWDIRDFKVDSIAD